MSTHTPGPWKYEENAVGARDILARWRILTSKHCVAGLALTGRADIDEANARLIAAAPNLLAALRECEASLTAILGNSGPVRNREMAVREHPALQAARAAIAKVEWKA